MTAFPRNSKADTRLLCTQALDMFVDQSQWTGDLTDQTTYLTSTSTRLGVRSPREIAVVATIGTGDSGIILNWGNVTGTSYLYRLAVSAGSLVFGHNNAALTTVAPPNVTGTARNYLIHWSTDYDFLAATWFSQIAILDYNTVTWKHVRITHTQPAAPAGGDQFNISGYGAGSSQFSGGIGEISIVRVSCRFHTTTEAWEDWATESSTPDTVGVRPAVELAPVSTVFYEDDPDTDVGDAVLDPETLAGPAEWIATVNAAAHRKRLYSPIVNLQPKSPSSLTNAYEPENFHRKIDLSDVMRWSLQHMWVRPVPRDATRARVRVYVLCYLAGGAPMGSAISFTVQLWAVPELPKTAPVAPAVASLTSQVTCTTNHTLAGGGEWLDLGSIGLRPGGVFRDSFYFMLAYKFGTGTGASYQRARIRQVVIDPYEE